MQQWERGYVEAALLITQGNLTRAAKLLGIHRTTLYSRMQNYADDAGKAARPAQMILTIQTRRRMGGR